MRKILFLGQLPPPVHGVSSMNSYLVNSDAIRTEFDIEVVDLKFGESIKELQTFSFKKVGKAAFFGFVILAKMIRQKHDIAYFTITPTGFGFYRDAVYVFLLKLFRSRIVLHLHGKGIQKNTGSFIKRKIYTQVFKNTSVVCLSNHLAADVKDIYKGKPFIVPNGIAVHNLSGGPKKKGNRTVPRILYVSNLVRNKGVLVLVEALAILKAKGHVFDARFVGAPYNVTVEMLQSTLRQSGLDQSATILGPLYGDAKFREYENADIFVFPTYNDVFGLVNLEAMQYNLPVVSTYEGSIPDVVRNNETGFLVNKEDPQMLAERIAVLLNDESLRIAMGAKGREVFLNHFTLQHFELNMLQTFKAVLSADRDGKKRFSAPVMPVQGLREN